MVTLPISCKCDELVSEERTRIRRNNRVQSVMRAIHLRMSSSRQPSLSDKLKTMLVLMQSYLLNLEKEVGAIELKDCNSSTAGGPVREAVLNG